MIQCRCITKQYDQFPIFRQFSYQFQDRGFYVLYGPSGSGKTTLFHILLGVVPFQGDIVYGNKEYHNQVVFDEVQDQIAYISQDQYFIDYLTMEENLTLECQLEREEIVKITKRLGIDTLLAKFPNQLSGGEKQRFAIAGNLLKKKKIFFFDEPTSNLDKKNKGIILEIFKQLKEKVLVICATHDDIFFQNAENVIDFNHLELYQDQEKEICNVVTPTIVHDTIRPSFSFSSTFMLFRSFWRQVKRNSKKMPILYVFIFFFSFLLCYACTDYESKLFSSLVNLYEAKAIRIDCSIDTKDYCQKILSDYEPSEVVYHYIRNLPAPMLQEGNVVVDPSNFRSDILSLPTSKEDMNKIDERLLYGTYFQEKNQVILGYERALELMEKYHVELKELIGRKEILSLPDGDDSFEIVGILKQMDATTSFYFQSILGPYPFDSYYYLSGSYLDKYLRDDVLGEEELNEGTRSTSLTIFFPDTYHFLKFYQDYRDQSSKNSSIRIYDPVNNFVEYQNKMESVRVICFSISLTFLTLAMIFYFQMHKTQNTYTEHYYCIYQYYGYQHKEIKWATVFYFVTYILGIIILSLLASITIGWVLNQIVIKYFLPFPLFQVNWSWIFALVVILCTISMIEGLYLNWLRRKDGWYQMLKEKSDLL